MKKKNSGVENFEKELIKGIDLALNNKIKDLSSFLGKYKCVFDQDIPKGVLEDSVLNILGDATMEDFPLPEESLIYYKKCLKNVENFSKNIYIQSYHGQYEKIIEFFDKIIVQVGHGDLNLSNGQLKKIKRLKNCLRKNNPFEFVLLDLLNYLERDFNSQKWVAGGSEKVIEENDFALKYLKDVYAVLIAKKPYKVFVLITKDGQEFSNVKIM
jgi:hypothetical protein